MAEIKKYLSKDGSIRLAAVISTDLAHDAFRYNEASPLCKTLMARALTGAVLMASQTKESLGIGLHFTGDGPVKRIFASARYEGGAKVYCENRQAELSPGQLEIGSGLGQGRLDVVQSRSHDDEGQQGTVELLTGEIAEDLAYYLNQSQQIPAIVSLAARPAAKGIEVAGGYILELMPGYSEETLLKLENLQALMEPTSVKLRRASTAEDLVDIYLDSFDFATLVHPHTPHYHCGCTLDRVERSLMLLGSITIAEMIADGAVAQVNCEFCGKDYQLEVTALQRLLKSLAP